jgi:hypothetical protein
MVVQKLEQPPLNMVKAPVPANVTIGSSEPHTYILMTRDALTTQDKLLVLIPGSQISIGQWSRRVMCDENINEGSMIKTCLKALEQGYQVIITNPNANYWSDHQSWVRCTFIGRAFFLTSYNLSFRSKELDQNRSIFQKATLQRTTSTTFLSIMLDRRPLPTSSSWAKVGLAT